MVDVIIYRTGSRPLYSMISIALLLTLPSNVKVIN
jgi:hypothetical protein